MKRVSIVLKNIFLMNFMALMGCAKISFAPAELQKLQGVIGEPAIVAQPPALETAPEPIFKTINKTEFVDYGNKQVDFLLVLDDSNSMLPDLKKLAARLSSFVSSLEASSIDWQMCLTTTRGYSSSSGGLKFGIPQIWKNYSPQLGVPSYLLKRGAANLNAIFNSTIDSLKIGGANSADERAIRATYDNFQSASVYKCYRDNAAISVIAISDEDERSLGGDVKNRKSADSGVAYQPLEVEDLPQSMVAIAQSTFGKNVRFTFNSIIVAPGDRACELQQDKDTSPSHFGSIYAEASRMTGGGVGSICEMDYSANLNTFKDKIVNSMSSISLECVPDPQSLVVTLDKVIMTDFKLDESTLKFNLPILEGTRVDLKYNCPM